MDQHELSRILIKVAGISIIIYVLVGIPAYISYYFSLRLVEESVITFFLVSILPMLIPLTAGYLMWQFPSTIANKIIKTKEDYNPRDSRIGFEIQIIAFSVLGMYLLFNSFSDIVYHLSYYFQTKEASGEGNIMINTYSLIFATAAEILFACLLLFGGKYIVGLIRKIRYGNESN